MFLNICLHIAGSDHQKLHLKKCDHSAVIQSLWPEQSFISNFGSSSPLVLSGLPSTLANADFVFVITNAAFN